MISSACDPERVEVRNRLIVMDEMLPPVLASLPDASGEADDIAECLFERHRGAYADEPVTNALLPRNCRSMSAPRVLVDRGGSRYDIGILPPT